MINPISLIKCISCICLLILTISCNTIENSEEARCKVIPFELTDVKLLDGPFKHATELNKKSLLAYNPDRLLSKFKSEAGLKIKAKPYEGWEAETLAGHSLGHYLSGCSLMFQTTGDSVFYRRVNYIINELEACQSADGNGYIGAVPNCKSILENEVAKGDISSLPFSLNGIWSPFYTQHKLMAGLRDAYHLCGIKKALEIEIKFADWLNGIVENLNNDQIQKMLVCEYGGINETLVDLYDDTNNKKYLDLSNVFYHKAILDSLAAGIDILPNKHANTQIPKLIGLARRYEITGNLKDKKTAEFFWNHVVNNHSYVTGGHGNHEYFGQPDQLRNRLSDETTETCNVYNMLKLSRHLFQWNPRAEVADFYERALFNHILSSQNPENGRVTYFLSLEMGGYKSFQDPESFTCCIGTAMESHSKYGRNIFYKGEDELYVSQFIASTVHWEEKNIVITQKTNFPQEQGTKIIIDKADSQQFTLYIRYPSWAEKGINILVNGKHQEINQQPGSFVAIKRTWNAGDSINVSFPYTLKLETMPDDTNRVAVLYGPLVLAGVLSAEDDPKANNSDYVPVLFPKDRDPNNWLSPIEDAYNTFKISEDIAKPQGFILKPLYTIYDRRYSVYWDLYDKERWKQHQLNIEAEIERKKKLEEKTLDFFQPGNAQQEMNHSFDGENTSVIEFKNRNARVADRGGWFSFELNVKQNIAITLVVEYWGGFTGSKTFDILIDGNKIATENIADKKDGQFIEVQYDIESKLITNKNRITVTFSPHWGNRAGPVFGARTIMQ